MEDIDKLKAIMEVVSELATKKSEIGPGAIVDDYVGGNVDDAYSMGIVHGEAGISKTIMEILER